MNILKTKGVGRRMPPKSHNPGLAFGLGFSKSFRSGYKYFCVIIFLIKFHLVFCQQGELLKSFEDSLKSVQTISYSATVSIKKFSSEEFNERHFDVYAKRNPSNKGYNFDWEIVDYKGGMEQRYLYIGSDFYYINKKYKVIGCRSNVKHLSSGDYFEFVRWNTLFDEILYGMDSLYTSDNMVAHIDEMGRICIKIKINKQQDRWIFLNRINLFPDSVRNVVRSEELGSVQIIKTRLSNIKINSSFPDTILVPQYYLDKEEYEVKHQGDSAKKENSKPTQYLSDSQVNFLLQAPLVSVTGDSIILRNVEAKFMLVDFWYMSCLPCLKSIPELQKLFEQYKSKGLKVIGINCYDGSNSKYVINKMKENGVSYPNFFADKSIIRELNIKAFPAFIILDENRNIIYRGSGVGKDFEEIEAIIGKALKE